jgi:hypothetical protein
VGEAACDLCQASKMTTWYHDDDECWIADCEICEVPMVVWRVHGTDPPPEVLEHLTAALRSVADARFGADGYRIDDNMRNIPDHYHAHARDHDFWTRFMGRRR